MKTKAKVELGITCVLAVVLLFTIMNTLKKVRQKSSAPAIARQTADSFKEGLTQQVAVSSGNLFKRLEEESDSLGLRIDPFSGSLLAPSKTSSVLSLNGILWDKTNPLAMINDEVVRVGSKIAGNKVVDIQEDRVILNNASGDFELRL
ncbi:MAG: hypothetical protein FJZ08_01305 [Candidatus Omnitrophica bacterium]|nr:hypothetical protein [Candidatus Omnitrophota bacterium]